MVEKRIVTKNKAGEVVKIVEHHDPNLEKRQNQIEFRFGVAVGVLTTVLVFSIALSRFVRL